MRGRKDMSTMEAMRAANETDERHHAGVSQAIDFLAAHYADQPSLDEAASVAAMSPFHFQRTFKDWTGISPKRFLQYVTLGHAKRFLDENRSVLDAALDAGLSGPSRLHDLFIASEAVTPGDFKARGAGLTIRYGVHNSPFGRLVLGETERGICWLGFVNDTDDQATIEELRGDWPAAEIVEDQAGTSDAASRAFAFAMGEGAAGDPVKLVLIGTNFQIKVWEALMRIPYGGLVSYGDLADAIGNPKASRAVGRAVGANPISLLIPCHRAILSSGVIHNYRWGVGRKRCILALEQARLAG